MRKLLTFLFLSTFGLQAQDLNSKGIWRSLPIKDANGKEIRRVSNDFLVLRGDTVYMLRLQDHMHMETGESEIVQQLDTFLIRLTKLKDRYRLSKVNDTTQYTMTVHSSQLIEIQIHQHLLTFENFQVSPQLAEVAPLDSFLWGKTVIPPANSPHSKDLQWSYMSNGYIEYSSKDGKSTWESAYQFVNFHGFILIKGITTFPFLVTEITQTQLSGYQLDHRQAPLFLIYDIQPSKTN